jgi:hypothetical protein
MEASDQMEISCTFYNYYSVTSDNLSTSFVQPQPNRNNGQQQPQQQQQQRSTTSEISTFWVSSRQSRLCS